MHQPVLGGVGIVMFGTVAASGISTGTIAALILNLILEEEKSGVE
jgi:xanthine/uracil permease